MVYGHANGHDLAETSTRSGAMSSSATRRSARSAAFRASPATYGVGRGKHVLRARRGRSADRERVVHRAATWPPCRSSSRAARGFGSDLASAARRAPPPDADRGRPARQALEPYRLFWLEDPSPAEHQDDFRLIRQHTTTPLAIGEVFNSIWDCQQLIQEQLIDFIRDDRRARGRHHPPAADRCTSPSSTRCAPAATARPTSRPVCMAAALHLDLAIPNFGLQEYMRHTDDTDARLPARLHVRATAMLHPGDAPGLGVTIDEELAARFRTSPRCCRWRA